MTKRLTLFVFLLGLSFRVLAQAPVNDDCAGLIDLGYAPTCPTDTFTNINATASDIGSDNNPSCFNSNIATHDVWFMFTCPDTAFDFRITLTGVTANSIVNPEFAIYRGDCAVDGLAELLCVKADPGETSVFLDVVGLTPGLPYFIRVSDYSVTAAPNWGNFTLCVSQPPPASGVDEGGSNLCSGTLYDTGGPDGDYGSDEDNVFVICPSQPAACITFTMDYYNFDQSTFGGDVLTFYDGDDTNSPILAQIGGGGFGPPNVSGGGAVCFKVMATSGCLTVQMQSDFAVEQEGFVGHWECSSEPCMPVATPTINTNISNQVIVDAVSTPATTVTITDINCPDGAYGTFSYPTDDNDLGLSQGLLLTSGLATIAIGPNGLTGAGLNNLGEGDVDLDYLSSQQGGANSFDACVVELDVFAATDELTFEYVFGSDEYPEYVGSGFNDIFAFFVSGPGIVGDPNLSNNAKNIAIIPGTANTPVQINSVNNDINWQFYRNNEIGQSLEYDGLTSDELGIKKSLTARTDVIPCNTYHLKLAVADRADHIFDSGVFVSKIQGGTPNLAVQFASGIDYFIEDCSGNQDVLIISLSEPPTEVTSFLVTVGGTATLGVDYMLNIPNIITFQPGQQQVSFPIVPIADALVEGTETITISLSNNFGCGTVIYKTLTINLEDNVNVYVNAGADTVYVCAGATLQLEAFGATNYFWAPPGLVSNPFISNPTITPAQDLWISVTGTVNNCVDIDSVYVRIISPSIDVTALSPTNVCQGTPVLLQAANNVSNSALTWTPAAGLDDPHSPTPVATPTVTTTYKATVSIAGCAVSDQVTINVDTLFFPSLTVWDGDTTVCQNYPVQLANILNTTTDYLWSPASGLDDPTSSGPVALPDVSTVYTLTATSAHNYCTQTATVAVNVIAADIDIQGDVYREICLGDTVALNVNAQPAGSQVTWTPPFYLSSATGPNVNAFPDESVTFVATYNVNNCVVKDSVHFRVDSLPAQFIARLPDKPVYCIGDTIILYSPTYEPAGFPDIEHNWIPFGGEQTPAENWNMVIVATATHTYQRETTNHACSNVEGVDVPVSEPPTITIQADPSSLCAGQTTQLTASVLPAGTKLEWENTPGLSCTDCPNPTATVFSTSTFTVMTPDAPCPSSESIQIEVFPAPQLAVSNDTTICLGEDVELNHSTDPAATYNWSPAASLDNATAAQPIASPTQTTTYTLEASVQNCTIQEEVTVTVADATVNAGVDETVCEGTQVSLNATVTGTQGGAFVWAPDLPSGNPLNITPTDTTTYTVTYLYGTNGNCQSTDQVTINVAPNIGDLDMVIVPDTTTFCQGTAFSLLATGAQASNVVYTWTENNVVIDGQTLDSIRIQPAEDGVYSYIVTAVDVNGCTGTAGPVNVEVIRCIQFPNAFSPDGDGTNDTFGGLVLLGGEVDIIEFTVYNRWGQKVFEASEGKTTWDGTVDGKDAPSDVYVFYLRYRLPNGAEQTPVKGEVTLLR